MNSINSNQNELELMSKMTISQKVMDSMTDVRLAHIFVFISNETRKFDERNAEAVSNGSLLEIGRGAIARDIAAHMKTVDKTITKSDCNKLIYSMKGKCFELENVVIDGVRKQPRWTISKSVRVKPEVIDLWNTIGEQSYSDWAYWGGYYEQLELTGQVEIPINPKRLEILDRISTLEKLINDKPKSDKTEARKLRVKKLNKALKKL